MLKHRIAFEEIGGLPRSIFHDHLCLEQSDKVIPVILNYMYNDVSVYNVCLVSNSRNYLFCFKWSVLHIEGTSFYSLIICLLIFTVFK